MNAVTVTAAFVAGLLSFLSPCVFPLVPIYIGYMTGTVSSQERLRLTTLAHAGFFVLGFGAVFIVLGAAAGLLGSIIYPALPYITKVGGGILIILGLHLTGLVAIPFLNMEKRLELGQQVRKGYWSSALVGVIFAAGWTPCVGPVLAAILLLAADSQTVIQGALLLGVYALGLGLPFLLVGGLLDALSPTLRRLSRYLRVLQIIGGLLLIIMGGLLLTGLWETLTFRLGSLGGGL
jgi:cytochrome c-type biogenesis protein